MKNKELFIFDLDGTLVDAYGAIVASLNFARKKLNGGSRCFKPCNKCDVVGDLVGSKHVKAWDEVYKK